MEFARAAQAAGIAPITGAELTLIDGSHLTFLVETVTGYSNLSRLITAAYAGQTPPSGLPPSPHLEVWKKMRAATPPRSLALPEHAQGLILLTGCRRGALAPGRRWLLERRHLLDQYVQWFGSDNVAVELQHSLVFGDTRRVAALSHFATNAGLPPNGRHRQRPITVRSGTVFQDVLVAIRHRTTLDGCHRQRLPNAEFFFTRPKRGGRAIPRPIRRPCATPSFSASAVRHSISHAISPISFLAIHTARTDTR